MSSQTADNPDTPLHEITSKEGGFKEAWKEVSREVVAEENDEEEEEEEGEERDRFSSPYCFVLTCIGLAVGLGNVWRFPSLAFEKGGGAFLIPYFIISLLFGIPLVYMEIAMGQYIQSGTSTMFYKYMPAFQGIGWTMMAMCLQVTSYYYILVAYAGMYLVDIILGQSKIWTRCQNTWNSQFCFSHFDDKECRDMNVSLPFYFNNSCHNETYRKTLEDNKITLVLPADEYFWKVVIMRSSSIEDFQGFNWKILVAMAFLWSVCAICQTGGPKLLGRISYFTTTAPFVIITILLIKGLTLPGALNGVHYFLFQPDFSKMLEIATWKQALMQMCYSLSVGYGCFQTLASYNPRNQNCFRDSLLIVAADSLISVISSIAVFSMLGYVSNENGKPLPELVQDPFSLAFIVFPDGMSRMNVPWLWEFLFFFMLCILGFSTVIVHIEIITSCFSEYYSVLTPHKPKVAAVSCLCAFLLALPIYSKSGIFWFTIFDECAGGWAMAVAIILELGVICFAYGVQNFVDDIEVMLGPTTSRFGKVFGKTGGYFRINWITTSPFMVIIIIVMTMMRSELQTGKGERAYTFPTWANVLGWLMSFSVLWLIPFFFVFNIVKMRKDDQHGKKAFQLHHSHPSFARIERDRETQKQIHRNKEMFLSVVEQMKAQSRDEVLEKRLDG